MSTRRRATGGIPRALDPVRARRASQQASAGQTAGPGQLVDTSGRIVPHLGDVQYVDRDGAQQIRLGDGLVVTTGSPKRIDSKVQPREVAKAQATADVAVEASADLDGRFTAAIIVLNGQVAALQSADTTHDGQLADHESRIVALEAVAPTAPARGTLTLTGTSPVTVSEGTYLADLALCTVVLVRVGASTSAGHLYLDMGSSADGKFYVYSDDPSDDGLVQWTVIL